MYCFLPQGVHRLVSIFSSCSKYTDFSSRRFYGTSAAQRFQTPLYGCSSSKFPSRSLPSHGLVQRDNGGDECNEREAAHRNSGRESQGGRLARRVLRDTITTQTLSTLFLYKSEEAVKASALNRRIAASPSGYPRRDGIHDRCRRQTIPGNPPTKPIYKGSAFVANFCI